MAGPLTDSQRLAWLRLARSEHVGPITFFKLLERYGSAEAALAALPELAQRGGRKAGVKTCSKAQAQRELDALAALGGTLVAYPEPGYPAALRGLDDAPPVLARCGAASLLARPAAALVGARNASANGRRLAQGLAGELAAQEVLVVSGLARGIDTAAHQGALEGGTAAVLAGGLDVPFPPENRELYAAIAEAGVLLSEAPLGQQPQARHFPRRNRLIAGLSQCVTVVEAAPRSGSLITARLAGEQGREVGAVPGSPLDGRARGANGLLREGARLIESGADVLAALAAARPPTAEETGPEPSLAAAGAGAPADESALAEARAALWAALSPSPVPVDALIRHCQVSPATAATVLLELELAGRLERHPGGAVAAVETVGA